MNYSFEIFIYEMYTTFDEMAGRPMTMATLADSKWLSRFLDETPGDSQIGGNSRQVPNACWSRVVPFCHKSGSQIVVE